MSVAGVPSQSVQPYTLQTQSDQRSAVAQLSQAISAGNLQEVRQADAALGRNLSTNQQAAGGSQNAFTQAIGQIGSALSSGDITQAQSALQPLPVHRAHGHHHKDDTMDTNEGVSASMVAATLATSDTISSSGTSSIDITV